ncbi:hypothetical protein [Kingella sp. (in: b-proteobacteria)]|uniref:hypothetical protein n=1 Tax=Kingella sp. (in: b-proteobacteria) TaxID=2020713 RepID=UPI0026DBC7CD|nr:hypothetical protein [Kingella sp. (in: b-proteobacteria)]MDO4656323.1 hypothetical protein [Kingella sp. (in: b-proteobacteria)]
MSDYSDYSSDELLSIRDSLLAEADELLEQLILLKGQNADSQQIDDVTTQMYDKMTAAQDVEDEMYSRGDLEHEYDEALDDEEFREQLIDLGLIDEDYDGDYSEFYPD